MFRLITSSDHFWVSSMIKDLYKSLGAKDEYITDEKISATFQRAHTHPEHLKIEVFESENKIVGYAILFDFWYNEYGGMVLQIDELYVIPEFRGKGIASEYVAKLARETKDHVALSLEVLPENEKAWELYKRMGFEQKETLALHKIL